MNKKLEKIEIWSPKADIDAPWLIEFCYGMKASFPTLSKAQVFSAGLIKTFCKKNCDVLIEVDGVPGLFSTMVNGKIENVILDRVLSKA